MLAGITSNHRESIFTTRRQCNDFTAGLQRRRRKVQELIYRGRERREVGGGREGEGGLHSAGYFIYHVINFTYRKRKLHLKVNKFQYFFL